MFILNFEEFFNRMFKEFNPDVEIELHTPKDAVIEEHETEEDGFRTVVRVITASGYRRVSTTKIPLTSKLDVLKMDLQKAIDEQRFEDAAKLRDEINDFGG